MLRYIQEATGISSSSSISIPSNGRLEDEDCASRSIIPSTSSSKSLGSSSKSGGGRSSSSYWNRSGLASDLEVAGCGISLSSVDCGGVGKKSKRPFDSKMGFRVSLISYNLPDGSYCLYRVCVRSNPTASMMYKVAIGGIECKKSRNHESTRRVLSGTSCFGSLVRIYVFDNCSLKHIGSNAAYDTAVR